MSRIWLIALVCVLPAACGPEPTPTAASTPVATTAPAPSPAIGTPVKTTPPRILVTQDWVPFATVGGITLHHPSRRVERVGFHQSNHEGAQEFTALETAVRPATLESRERLTSSRTAADVVSDPEVEIRAPVTGRVKRAGGYVLYCKYSDDYLVIAPDARPDWEVKLLHIDGVTVRAGDRVEAGKTVVAPRPTRLAFESQVDELATGEAWPHVHIEVVNPAIPNRSSPGSGC